MARADPARKKWGPGLAARCVARYRGFSLPRPEPWASVSPWWASRGGAIKGSPAPRCSRQPGAYAVLAPSWCHLDPYTPCRDRLVVGACTELQAPPCPRPFPAGLAAGVCCLSYSERMNDEAHAAAPGDQPPPATDPHGWPFRQPPTEPSPDREPYSLALSPGFKARLEQHYLQPGECDRLAAGAAVRRAGHKGRHHSAGHASGRAPWKACGQWRPVAGVTCPVCPDVCPGCGAYYVTPFPVDPRDG